MISANQKYKRSGTTKSFKDWLKEEQTRGDLAVHENQNFVNISGEKKPFIVRNRKTLMIIGVGIASIGLIRMLKNK